MPDTPQEIKEVVVELLQDEEVIQEFIDFSDLLREMLEERLDTIKARKEARKKVIAKLISTYW